jgi:RecB family endonuclease NucS
MTEYDTLLKSSEKEQEDYILEHIDYISEMCGWGDVLRVERQLHVPLKTGRVVIDIMIWHKDGSGTAIEIKTGNNNRNDDMMGIGQLLFYGYVLESRLTKLPRLVLAMPSLKQELVDVIRKFNVPISILNYSSDKCIYLQNGTK